MEQSAPIWHSSLTRESILDLECVQKNACRVILKEKYSTYKESLEALNILSLYDRREELALKFAINCKDNEKTEDLFPLNKKKHKMKTRRQGKYKITHSKKERMKKSVVPYLQKLLNNYEDNH